MAGMLFDEIVKIEKMNPYHGRDGRFTTAQAATSFTYKPGASTAHNRAIEREKERNGETRSFKGTLYHGSPATDIEEFDMNRAGQNTSSGEKLLFFTDSKQMAEDFSYERLEGSSKFFQRRGEKGRVYEVDVEMKNALDLRNLSEKDIGNLMKLDVEGILTKEIAVELSGKNNQLLKTYLNLTAASLSELGYDGLIANTGKAGHNSVEYAVVDGKQAKIRKGLSKNFDEILKYNDKHDKLGRFASKDGGAAGGSSAALKPIKPDPRWAYQPDAEADISDMVENPLPFVGVGTDMDLAVKFEDETIQSKYISNTEVNISDLQTLQPFVLRSGVENYKHWDDSERPYVIDFEGSKYVIDGNHRIAQAKIKGEKTVNVDISVREMRVNKSFDEIVEVEKFNPYHDAKGRFASANGSAVGGPTMDSSGRGLSAEQTEYFKNSKVRDADGNLLVMYHGTANAGEITVFDGDMLDNSSRTSQIGQGFYFTNAKAEAVAYMENVDIYGNKRNGTNPHLHEVYLDIQRPFDVRNDTLDLAKAKAVYMEGGYDWFYKSGLPHQLANRTVNGKSYTKSELENMGTEEKVSLYVDFLHQTGGAKSVLSNMVRAYKYGNQDALLKSMEKNLGVDGLFEEFAEGKFQYVAFNSSQIKSVGNTKPTNSADIKKRGCTFDQIVEVEKFNPYHDAKGRFASANGGGATGGNPFPNSKVQAAVYHGTTETFDDFDTSKSKEGNGTIFFSANEDYCEEMISVRGDSGRILTAYINMENPLEVKLKPNEFSDPVVERKYIREAKQNGNDGVIFECDTDDALLADTFYSVFDPKQIAVAETADFAKSADLTPDEEHDMVVKTWTDADGIYAEDVEKGNPYHDPKTGRFTTGPGGSSMIRQGPPPKNTKIAYKLFVAKNGKLYPPMVANPDGQDTPVGVWLDAAEGKLATDKDGNPITNTLGRNKVKAGGKGTQGGSGTLAYRPGWHLGEVPEAKQFYTKDKVTGEKLQKKNFVWAECEIAADFNYQEEAMSYGYNKNGKFQHSLAGLPKIPTDGYYTYRTNPDPSTQPWYITGAMKVNRLLTDAETNAILRSHGIEPMKRDGGELDLAALGFTETNFVGKSAPADINMEKETEPMEKNFEIFKSDPDKRLVFGWASISYTVDGEQLEDRQKDMIDPEDLEEAVYEYVLNFRDTGEEHIPTMRKKGKLVESCVLTEEKQRAMGIPAGTLPIGWWIGFKIEDDDAWERVKNGTYRMFSIEGKANREPVEKSLEEEREEKVAKTFNEILGVHSTTRTIEKNHPDRFDHIDEVEKSGDFDHLVEVEKFNPYHGKDGRFASANSATSFTYAPGKSNAHDLAIARAAAKDRVAKAKEAEPALTKMMQGCAAAAGGELVGLEYCVKGEGSLTRKIKTEMGENGSNVNAAVSRMRDVNRYTMQLGEDNFVSGFDSTMKTLQSQGHEVVRVKNTLKDPSAPYRGVNTNIKAPDGSIWELQFHTAKSLEIKEVNHKLYETQRLDKTPAAKRAELGRQMAENAASIPSPAGIEKIAAVNKL